MARGSDNSDNQRL